MVRCAVLQYFPKVICLLIVLQEIIFSVTVFAVEENSSSRSAYVEVRNNKRLTGHVVKTLASPSLMSCGQSCLRNSWCTSTNFKESFKQSDKGTCELNKHENAPINGDSELKFVDQAGVTFSMFLKGCPMTGCLNEGSCLFDEKNETFSCSCKLPWSGDKCEVEMVLFPVYVVLLLATLSAAKVPKKKCQKMLYEIRNELRELREEIKCLKGNEAIIVGVYKNCAELYEAGKRTSGVYTINPDNGDAFDVYCDQTTDGGGWTVFQKRLNGSVDFYRGWADYKAGFGNLSGEFWLGLDKIHRLTKERSKLRVDLEDFSSNTAYAEYSFFGVGDEGSKYNLTVGSYSGTAGDSLSYHSGMEFSTKDRDNDKSSRNCATLYKGAWWYNSCHHSNLNGRYLYGTHSSFADGVNWKHWKGFYYSVKRAEMKIKPVEA